MSGRAGFTLIEMIVFTAIFAVAMGAFMAVFTNVAGVQVRQSSVAEVQSQSQFLLQEVQYYVQRSSFIAMQTDVATTTLTLRMASSTEDPVVISLNGTGVQLTIGGGAVQALTSSRVNVSGLNFVKHSNPGGHDSVSVSFTVAYNTANPGQSFQQSLQMSISRISAASFTADVQPDSGGTRALGVSSGDWRSINNTIFFSGSNVGISNSSFSPSSRLDVQGDIRVESGDVYTSATSHGAIFKAADGSCWRVTISSAGVLGSGLVSCP